MGGILGKLPLMQKLSMPIQEIYANLVMGIEAELIHKPAGGSSLGGPRIAAFQDGIHYGIDF